MDHRRSLFATMLRAYRAGPGAAGADGPSGAAHGRMTQEQLAERLGLSTEAIGKYERSASYIRGDLESRLVERLGWSAADVAACREDWDAHHLRPRQGGYRTLGPALMESTFSGSAGGLARAITRLVASELPGISEAFGPDDDLWVPIIERFPHHGGCVVQGGDLVAHWAIQFLNETDRDRLRNREFVESDLAADRLIRPLLPGTYYGYCPLVLIASGHERAAPQLLGSAQAFLEELAERGIVLSGIGTAAVSAEGRQLCRQLGLTCLGPHRTEPGCEVWELPGEAIGRSILARRSPVLRAVYAEAFGPSA